MISNFIAHLQSSDYRGEKLNRPQRHVREAVSKWAAAGKAAQLANIRAQERHYQQQKEAPSSPPFTSFIPLNGAQSHESGGRDD